MTRRFGRGRWPRSPASVPRDPELPCSDGTSMSPCERPRPWSRLKTAGIDAASPGSLTVRPLASPAPPVRGARIRVGVQVTLVSAGRTRNIAQKTRDSHALSLVIAAMTRANASLTRPETPISGGFWASAQPPNRAEPPGYGSTLHPPPPTPHPPPPGRWPQSPTTSLPLKSRALTGLQCSRSRLEDIEVG